MKDHCVARAAGWAALFLMTLGTSSLSIAADHLDAPGMTAPGGDKRLDINDVYIFKSPSNSNNVVFIVTLFPLAGVGGPATFHPGASYEFKIDNDGDAKEDLTYRITFSAPNAALGQELLLRCTPASTCGEKGAVLARGQTATNVPIAGGGTIRAGLFDDPFFFDLNAFKGSRGVGARRFCDATPSNFFAGLNTLAIVIEVPRTALGSNNVGIWARTELGGAQIDRFGRPAINTVFIPTGSKNAFNAGIPRNDTKDFSGFFGALGGVLLPDIMTIDTSSSAGFLNGRRLQDDVIDIELNVITGGAIPSDCVANDSAFTSTFPYLAPPN